MKDENDPVLVSHFGWATAHGIAKTRIYVASQVALAVKNLPVMEETYLGLIPGLG